MPTPPIKISDDPLPATLSAAVRYAIVILAPILISRGWLGEENVETVTTIVIVAATVAYGLWRTYQTRRNLIVAAEAAPDKVAQVN